MSQSTSFSSPRLKQYYTDRVRAELMQELKYANVYAVPRFVKIVINMGIGRAAHDKKVLETAQKDLAAISGQKPSIRLSKKSIAGFKIRDGMPVGLKVTLRGRRLFEFFDRLVTIAMPRMKDFRGIHSKSFDRKGNISIGIRERLIFPEVNYDTTDDTSGMDITIVTTAKTDHEARVFLEKMGVPFRT